MGVLAKVSHGIQEEILVLIVDGWSAPIGFFVIVSVWFSLPPNFPHIPATARSKHWPAVIRESIERLDLAGAFLNLAASILLVFALEEGGSKFDWNSAPIITTFALSGVMWIIFIGWESYINRTEGRCQNAIFPMRLVNNRIFIGLLLWALPPYLATQSLWQ